IPGLSAITMMFDDDADLFRTRQLVAERLQLASTALPAGVEAPQLEPIQPPIGSLLKVCVTSADPHAVAQLRSFADWTMRPRLAGPDRGRRRYRSWRRAAGRRHGVRRPSRRLRADDEAAMGGHDADHDGGRARDR